MDKVDPKGVLCDRRLSMFDKEILANPRSLFPRFRVSCSSFFTVDGQTDQCLIRLFFSKKFVRRSSLEKTFFETDSESSLEKTFLKLMDVITCTYTYIQYTTGTSEA